MKTMDRISNKLIENRWAMGLGIALCMSITSFIRSPTNFFVSDPGQPAELSHYFLDSLILFISPLVGVIIAFKFIVPRRLCEGVSELGITLRIGRRSKILRWEDLEKIKIFEHKGEVVSRIVVKPSGKRSFDIFHKERDISLEAMIQEKLPANQNTEVIVRPPGFTSWVTQDSMPLILSFLGIVIFVFLVMQLL